MIANGCEYSEKEAKLIEHYGFLEIAKNLYPPVLYPMMASKAFVTNDQGPHADSLRRCIKALEGGKIYRMSPEFESLIQLD